MLSSAVLDTLIPRGEGTKTLIMGCTGRQLIIPFRGVIYSHIKRDTATFGTNQGWFFHPPLLGGLGQKLQLRLITWCNCFEVSGHYLGIYLTWICQGRPQLASPLMMTKGFEVLDGVKADLSI